MARCDRARAPVHHHDALRHVADALPGGVASAGELEELTAQVLESPRFVNLTGPGAPKVAATASKGVSAAAHMRDAGSRLFKNSGFFFRARLLVLVSRVAR